MSRVQTEGLGQIGLQPQARPTSQFYSPETRQSSVDNDLIGLAQGLGDLVPAIRQYASITGQKADTAAYDQGKIKGLEYKNQQAWKEAVKNGDVKYGDNPWFMRGLKESVAAVEADKAANDLLNDYSQSDVQHSDDIKPVEDLIAQHFAPLKEGRDVDELRSMAPVLQDAANSLVQTHINRRSHERVEEASAAVASQIGSLFEKYRGFNVAPDTAGGNNLAFGLAEIAKDKGRFLLWPDINKSINEAAAAESIARGDPTFIENVQKLVKTPGGTLAGSADSKALVSSVYSKIIAQQRELRNGERQQTKQNAEDFSSAFLNTQLKKLSELRQSQPNAKLEDIGFTFDAITDLPITDMQKDELRQKFIAYVGQRDGQDDHKYQLQQREKTAEKEAKQESTDEFASSIGKRMARGVSISPKEALGLYAAAGTYGFSALQNTQQTIDQFNRSLNRGESDPAVRGELLDKWSKGELDYQDVHTHWDSLSSQDQEKFSGILATAEKKTDGGILGNHGLVTMEAEALTQRIMLSAALAHQSESVADFEKNDPTQFSLAKQRAENSKTQFLEAMEGYSRTAQDKTFPTMMTVSDQFASRLVPPGTMSREKYETMLNAPPAPPKPADSAPKQETTLKPKTVDNDPFVGAISEDSLTKFETLLHTPAQTDRGPAGQSMPEFYTPGPSTRVARNIARDNNSFSATWSDLNELRYDRSLNQTNSTLARALPRTYGVIEGPSQDSTRYEASHAYGRLQARRQALASRIEATGLADSFQKKLDSFADGHVPTFDEKAQLIRDASILQEYATITQEVGYTPTEVKKLGDSAWRSFPMFANKADMSDDAFAAGGPKGMTMAQWSAQQAGVPNNQIREFITVQADLLARKNTEQRNENGR
jgi:hypothetical protein